MSREYYRYVGIKFSFRSHKPRNWGYIGWGDPVMRELRYILEWLEIQTFHDWEKPTVLFLY